MSQTLSLLQIYFEHFNSVVPLFDQTSFMAKIEQRFTQDLRSDRAWWGALNVMLSLAFRLQAILIGSNEDNDRRSWRFLQYALSVIPDLTFGDTSLLGVQTLLGMVIILQGTFNPHAAAVLIATAIKLLHQLGLHENTPNSGTYTHRIDQRNRTIWVAYILDKDHSLQYGQPPLLCDDDLDVAVPSENPPDGLGIIIDPVESQTLNLFRLRVHLAIIEDKIYTRLYSLQALKSSLQLRDCAVRDLSRALEKWQGGVPSSFQPKTICTHSTSISVTHLVILHLSYFHCLTMVYGVAFQSYPWVAMTFHSVAQDHSKSPLWYSLELCRPAARDAVKLMRLLPQGDYACVWYVHLFPVQLC